jgi:hypothetical protein
MRHNALEYESGRFLSTKLVEAAHEKRTKTPTTFLSRYGELANKSEGRTKYA